MELVKRIERSLRSLKKCFGKMLSSNQVAMFPVDKPLWCLFEDILDRNEINEIRKRREREIMGVELG